MRRLGVVLIVAVVSFATFVASAVFVPAGPALGDTDLDAFHGLGAWVDVFDYAPRTQPEGAPPAVTPAAVDDMAALGVHTLYIQVVNPEGSSPDSLVDARQLREFLARGHDAGLAVVAWYLPKAVDVASDASMMRTIAKFRSEGRGFDALALDLEDTVSVTDVAVRNAHVVKLAKQTRALLGRDRALGAIVYPAVLTELINPALWPSFPYRKLEPSVDVWLPMTYFTFRSKDSGYRDPLAYTVESVKLLRAHLRDQKATVHVVGGIADLATSADYEAFLRAARVTNAVGYSLYDYRTTSSAAWTYLRSR